MERAIIIVTAVYAVINYVMAKDIQLMLLILDEYFTHSLSGLELSVILTHRTHKRFLKAKKIVLSWLFFLILLNCISTSKLI